MTTVYRTTGAWGSGKGSALTKVEVDTNFYGHETRIATLEGAGPVSITTVTSSGSVATVHYSDSSTSSFTLPTAPTPFNFIGAWAPTTPYVVDDWITNNGTLYAVIFAHTSGSSFDPGANDGMGHNYYEVILSPPGNVLPTGGSTGMSLVKSSSTDFAMTWAFAIPNGGSIYQVLMKHSGTDQDFAWTTINAAHVSFSPSTASDLTSTNVADALDEVGAKIGTTVAGYLPLAGGTLTGTLVLNGDPVNPLEAATKEYADSKARFGTATDIGSTGTVSLDPSLGDVFTTTPAGAMTINAASAPVGAHIVVVVTTSGTSSYNLTFSSNFKTTGTLASGTVSGKVFTISFIGDGTNLNEVARTTAM